MALGAGRRRLGGALTRGAAVLLTASLVGLASCSDDDDEPAAPPSSGSAGGEPVDGGRVRVGVAGALVVDPVQASLASPSQLMVLDVLHDGLTELDGSGDARGALARSWTADPARTTWEFQLDPEATFTDGRTVTASDVVASLERVAAAGDTSLAALRLEGIEGFRAFVDGEADHLAGLSAPDGATVRVALDEPLSVLPELLASPVFGVVDRGAMASATAAAFDELPLSGAWSVATADVDELVLERRGEGHLDELQLRSYDDALAAYEAFDGGDLDWAAVPAERFGEAVERHGDDHFAPFHAELYFGLNVEHPKLAGQPLREAIAAAIDRDAIVAAVYDDLADPLATVVPAGVVGHDAERCAECGHDPARAEALVAAAFPDGAVPTVNVDFDESPAQEDMAEMVAADLEAVGIPAQLRPLSIEEYKGFVVSGNQELFSFGWIGVYASPDAYLAPLFGSSAADNLTGFASPDVDALLGTARGTGDATAALRYWAEAEAAVLRAAVVVPIAQFRTQVVVADRVERLEHAVDGTVDWSQVWVVDGR